MKIVKLAIVTTTLSLAAVPALAVDGSDTNDVSAETQKPKKITDRNDPNYIRCRSEPVIGSLTRKNRVCMTNAEWTEFNRIGNRRSQEFVNDMQTGRNDN